MEAEKTLWAQEDTSRCVRYLGAASTQHSVSPSHESRYTSLRSLTTPLCHVLPSQQRGAAHAHTPCPASMSLGAAPCSRPAACSRAGEEDIDIARGKRTIGIGTPPGCVLTHPTIPMRPSHAGPSPKQGIGQTKEVERCRAGGVPPSLPTSQVLLRFFLSSHSVFGAGQPQARPCCRLLVREEDLACDRLIICSRPSSRGSKSLAR